MYENISHYKVITKTYYTGTCIQDNLKTLLCRFLYGQPRKGLDKTEGGAGCKGTN